MVSLRPVPRGGVLSLGAVVGENLANVRGERRQTQREAAAFLSEFGLHWTPGAIGQLESGRRESVKLDELLLLSRAYGLPLRSWFEGTGPVTFLGRFTTTRRDVRDAVSGADIGLLPRSVAQAVKGARRRQDNSAEDAMAATLGVDAAWVRAKARKLWRRSLLREREMRVHADGDAPPRTIQARRGHATRSMEGELRSLL